MAVAGPPAARQVSHCRRRSGDGEIPGLPRPAPGSAPAGHSPTAASAPAAQFGPPPKPKPCRPAVFWLFSPFLQTWRHGRLAAGFSRFDVFWLFLPFLQTRRHGWPGSRFGVFWLFLSFLQTRRHGRLAAGFSRFGVFLAIFPVPPNSEAWVAGSRLQPLRRFLAVSPVPPNLESRATGCLFSEPLAGLLLKRRPEPGRYQGTLTFRQVAAVEVL